MLAKPDNCRVVMPDSNKTDIAVVGLGPRGLGALEALASRVGRRADPIRVDVF